MHLSLAVGLWAVAVVLVHPIDDAAQIWILGAGIAGGVPPR